jgi:ABC-type amino acid transport substrate-binding protein
MSSCLRIFLALTWLCFAWAVHSQEIPTLNVAVLEGSPPMSYRESNGQINGFSIGVMRALCEEMKVRCLYRVVTLNEVLPVLENGEFDLAAAALLDTPERRARVLMSRAIFRSRSVWLARPGIVPGSPKTTVAVVQSSAQERYAEKQGWKTDAVKNNQQISAELEAGKANAALAPLPTALSMMMPGAVQKMSLEMLIMEDAALGGDAAFPVSPHRPELKPKIDAAIEKIKRNGRYDRINSIYLPFRIE